MKQPRDTQMNVRIPGELKEWASHAAAKDFQSLNGFIAKLLHEEKKRQDNYKEVANQMK